MKKEQPESMMSYGTNGDSQDREDWQLVTSGNRRKSPSPPVDLQRQNMLSALVTNKVENAMSWEASEAAGPEPCIYTKRKQVIVVQGAHLLT